MELMFTTKYNRNKPLVKLLHIFYKLLLLRNNVVMLMWFVFFVNNLTPSIINAKYTVSMPYLFLVLLSFFLSHVDFRFPPGRFVRRLIKKEEIKRNSLI